jgi:hypothetical protein
MAFVFLTVYVPTTHTDVVKTALATSGAGRLGNYDSCMWQTLGTGQFRPLEGSNPFLGQQGVIEKVEEVKIECIVSAAIIKEVIAAMKKAHPYEVPAYSYHAVEIE